MKNIFKSLLATSLFISFNFLCGADKKKMPNDDYPSGTLQDLAQTNRYRNSYKFKRSPSRLRNGISAEDFERAAQELRNIDLTDTPHH